MGEPEINFSRKGAMTERTGIPAVTVETDFERRVRKAAQSARTAPVSEVRTPPMQETARSTRIDWTLMGRKAGTLLRAIPILVTLVTEAWRPTMVSSLLSPTRWMGSPAWTSVSVSRTAETTGVSPMS